MTDRYENYEWAVLDFPAEAVIGSFPSRDEAEAFARSNLGADAAVWRLVKRWDV